MIRIQILIFFCLAFLGVAYTGFAATVTLPETGQTLCYNPSDGSTIYCSGTAQDGELLKGAAWPNPRFTDNGNGTVSDNLTGLVWLKNANCFGAKSWANALDSANTLTSGACGLSDGSTAGSWRLPNRKELLSIVDRSKSSPALPAGHPFSGVQTGNYWSSTTNVSQTTAAWFLNASIGYLASINKSNTYAVLPVRGGQAGPFSPLALTVTKAGNGTGKVTASSGALTWLKGTAKAGFSAGSTVTLTAAADSGSTFTGWSGACSGTGTCALTMSGDQSVTATFAMPLENVITFPALSDRGYGEADFDPGASANSGLPISYTSSNSAVATIVGGLIHLAGPGTTVITASQAGDATYAAATNVTRNLTVTKGNQVITFSPLPGKKPGDSDFDPGATASSGLPVSYASSNSAVATIVSGKIHVVATGTAVITASQAGNTGYNAAPNVTQTLTVSTAIQAQTITFPSLAVKRIGDADFDPGATASSGLPISYASSNTAVATIVNGKIHVIAAGTSVISASQTGNASYAPATVVQQTLTVDKATQTISFTSLPVKNVGDADFDPGATATSGLSVSYSSSNTAVAIITNGKISIVGAGTSTITVSQAGNATYAPAPNVQQTLTVSKGSQTITFSPLTSRKITDADFSPGATASSGLAVSYSSSNSSVAAIVDGKIHIVGAGTTVITASQSGNASYVAAPDVSQTLTVKLLTVTPVGTPGGILTPDTPVEVASGASVKMTLTPVPGYHIESVTGCNGGLIGYTYSAVVTDDCSISVTFSKTDTMFNEQAYLAANPDVAKLVLAGNIATGWFHYSNWGKSEGRALRPADYGNFNEEAYLAANTEARKQLADGVITSGWQHYVNNGKGKGTSLSPSGYGSFSEHAYRAANPDVAQMIQTGTVSSGWEHYQNTGKGEGRAVTPSDYGSFNEFAYLGANPDIVGLIKNGTVGTGWQHYVTWGRAEGRPLSAPGYIDFNESAYLAAKPEIVKFIKKGLLTSGWQYYLAWGKDEGDQLAPSGYGVFSEAGYLAENPDIATLIKAGTFSSGWAHYLAWGKAEGRKLNPRDYGVFDEADYLAANPDVFRAVLNGVIASGWQHYSVSGKDEGRSLKPLLP